MSLDPLGSLLAAIVVLLGGTLINRTVPFLSKYNIPDPITGGVLFAIGASIARATTGFELEVGQTIKPVLLLMFFGGVGMCADLRMLKQGGKAFALFLLVLFPYILVQNAVGVTVATLLDLHPIFGLVGGSITLVGGHGTGAAYAARFAEVHNLQSVMELSMTAATLGLVLGGIVAGPVAQYLIGRIPPRSEASPTAASAAPAEAATPITTMGVIGTLAGILAAVVIGTELTERVPSGAITIPPFLWCMIVGVAIRNLAPIAGIHCDDRAADLIAGVCLSLFLVLTMMALDLVEVASSAGPLLLIIAAQVVFIALYAVYACFRAMGRDYEAAVTSAAFIGFSLGSTATAMANMQAITAKFGPAPRSYLIVPLAGAFFIDLMNAVVITVVLAMPVMGS